VGTIEATARPDWLPHEEYPFESRFVTVDGHRIHYVDEGDGPLLLFVHAGPGWSFVFRGPIVELRDRFRCVALDLPGSGLSPVERGSRVTFASSSRALEGFVRALDLNDVTLVAHDIGGPVSIDAFSRLEDRLRGFVITGSFAWPMREYPAIARMLRLVGSPAIGILDGATNLIARSTARFGLAPLSAAGRRAYRGPYRDRHVRRNARSMLGQAATSDDFLAGVRDRAPETVGGLPALIIWGEKDPTRKHGWPDRWQRVLPRARSHVIRGARHFPQMNAPKEVAGLIESWWREDVAPPLASKADG
jgi:haloalkane dehalogenase